MTDSPFKSHLRPLLVCSMILVPLLQACAPDQATRGNVTDPNAVKELLVGVHTRADVSALLGTPSALSTFDANTWYYVGQQKERTAFFDPELTDQKILSITFNKKGTIESIDDVSNEGAREIDPVARTTPTAGKSLTFLEQLIGNIGKFKK